MDLNLNSLNFVSIFFTTIIIIQFVICEQKMHFNSVNRHNAPWHKDCTHPLCQIKQAILKLAASCREIRKSKSKNKRFSIRENYATIIPVVLKIFQNSLQNNALKSIIPVPPPRNL